MLRFPTLIALIVGLLVFGVARNLARAHHARWDPRYRGYRRARFGSFLPVVVVGGLLALVFVGVRSNDVRPATLVTTPWARAPVMARSQAFDPTTFDFQDKFDRPVESPLRRVDRRFVQSRRQAEQRAAQLKQKLQRQVAQIGRQIADIERQVAQQQIAQQHQFMPQHFKERPVPPLRPHQDFEVAVAPTEDEDAIREPSAPSMPILFTSQSNSSNEPVAVSAPPAAVTPVAVAPEKKPVIVERFVETPQTPVAASPAPAKQPDVAAPSSSTLPDWAKSDVLNLGSKQLMVVSGGVAGSRKEAEREALNQARLVIGNEIRTAYPKVGRWEPSAEQIRQTAVRLTFVEEIPKKTLSTGTPFVVYRAYHQIELSPTVYARLIGGWKDEVIPHRLEAMAGLVALLTLTFGTGAAYFRLNERTHGQYRWRLKLAAASVIAGAGMVAAYFARQSL